MPLTRSCFLKSQTGKASAQNGVNGRFSMSCRRLERVFLGRERNFRHVDSDLPELARRYRSV
jgi:hypothetical protein